jgi:hypothetical protein
MATTLNIVVVDKVYFVIADASPVPSGLDVNYPQGSFIVANDGSGLFYKFGASNTDYQGYQLDVQIDTTGNPLTITDGKNAVYIDPGGVTAAKTITMPSTPFNGQEVSLFFGGTIGTGSPVVTLLTLSPNAGQTIIGTLPTTANGGDSITFKYRSDNSKWYVKA